MKKQILTLIGLIAVIYGCNKAELEENSEVRGEGVWATIEQPFSPEETKALSWGDNRLSFSWASGESVVAFGGDDAALLRTVSSGEMSSKLESKGFQLMDGVTYYAFIPADNFNIVSKSTAVPMTFLGQRQTKNDNSDHLRYYDYAYAKATKATDSNSLEFNLQNQVSWIVVEHTFAEDLSNVTELSLSTSNSVFVSFANLNLSTGKFTGKKSSKELSLALGSSSNGISFKKGEFLRAFFTIFPTDFSNEEITLTVKLKDGTSKELGRYKSASLNIPRNTPAIIRTSGTAAPVAICEGKNYSSLNAAIEAAATATKAVTIELSGDVQENVVVNGTKNTLTIDLKGHSITAASGKSVVVNVGSVKLTNGTIVSEKGVGVAFGPTAKSAKITLEDCNVSSVEGAVCTSTATDCTVNIYGGVLSASDNAVIAGNGSTNYSGGSEARESGNKIIVGNELKGVTKINGKTTTAGYKACGIYAPWKDDITVSNVEFNIENGVGILSRGGAVTINSGMFRTSGEGFGMVGDSRVVVPCKTVFIDTECEYAALGNAKIVIKSGSFSDDAGREYVAVGSKLTQTEDADVPFAVVNNAISFAGSISAAVEGSTVTVEDDVVLSGRCTIEKNVDLDIKENVTLSSGSATPSGVLEYKASGRLSGAGAIKGSPSNSSNSIAVSVQTNGGTVTIDGDITVSCEQGEPQATPVKLWFGKVIINGGHFISGADKAGNESPAVHLYPKSLSVSAYLEINGGVFESSVTDNPNYLINCEDDCRSRCTVVVKGGTFVGFNPADNISEGAGTNYVPDGYVSVETTLPDGRKAWVVSKAE